MRFKTQAGTSEALPVSMAQRWRMTLKLAMLAAGATLGSVASFAADDASMASRETVTVSPEAAADAVDVADRTEE